jgi:peptidyl-prolyl cis-trans isomerase B (cyclophilin B)
MKNVLRMCALLLLISGTAGAQEESYGRNPEVTIHTSKGDIRLVLFADKAPVTVENFLQYAREGFYDGTIFHRVISYFMIQGGGYTADMERKPTRDPISNEADNGLKNQRGTIAMARTMDVDSATAQFFINVEDNPGLDHSGKANSAEWGYAVFGKVLDGMDVVNDIRVVETTAGNVPVETVLIESVEVH